MHRKDVFISSPDLDIYSTSASPPLPTPAISGHLFAQNTSPRNNFFTDSALPSAESISLLHVFHSPYSYFRSEQQVCLLIRKPCIVTGVWVAFSVSFFSTVFSQKWQSCLLPGLTEAWCFIKISHLASCFPCPLVVPVEFQEAPTLLNCRVCWFGLSWCVQTSLELCTSQGHSLPPPLTWPRLLLLSIHWAWAFGCFLGSQKVDFLLHFLSYLERRVVCRGVLVHS